jgi:hypothetical protein
MSSINELLKESEREMYPTMRATLSPIPIKLLIDDIDFEDIHDFNSVSTSRFETEQISAKWMEEKSEKSESNNTFKMKFKHGRVCIENSINKEKTVYETREEASPIEWVLKCAVWLCYLLSTAEANFQSLQVLHLVNLAGIALACYLSYRPLITLQAGFEEILHALGLVTTIALHFYSVDVQDGLVVALHVIRSCRLIFLLGINHNFKDLILKYAGIVKKIVKVALPLLVVVLTISLMLGQGGKSSLHSRCRYQDPFYKTLPPPTDDVLCGSRTCPENQACINPFTYSLPPVRSEYENISSLAYGYFSFSSLHRSFFTVFELSSLAQTSQVIDIVTIN